MRKVLRVLKQVDHPRKILPALMTLLTRHPRYLPEIKWVSNLWTHNIFRVYELIFWRRIGIRAEAASESYLENEEWVTRHYIFTFEAACAHLESMIRARMPRLVKVYVPVLSFAGVPNGFIDPSMKPYLFAIAYGSGTNQDYNNQSSATLVSPSVSGSNTGGVIGAFCQIVPETFSTHTWNGVVATSIGAVNGSGANERMESFFLASPSAGATNIVVVRGGSTADFRVYGAYYTGCKQTSSVEANSTVDATTATQTLSLTTTANACVMCWIRGTNGSAYSGGTNTTVRLNQNASVVLADTSPTAFAAGSNAVQITSTSQQGFGPYWSIAAATAASTNFLIMFQ